MRYVALKKMYYTPAEFGAMLGVSRQTVVGWIWQGRLKAMQTPGGHYRIPASEVRGDYQHEERIPVKS